MFKKPTLAIRAIFVLILSAYTLVGWAQEKIEGKVVSSKLTACSFKPGGCEGSLVLEAQRAGKMEQVTIKVLLGTQIKKGEEYVYLPTLRGNRVSIAHATEKGEKVAKTIDVVETAKP